MSHTRKKGGQRKDHKVERMKKAVDARHAEHDAKPERPTTDQHDIQSYKPGGPSDKNRTPPVTEDP